MKTTLIDQTIYGLPSNTRFCDIWDEEDDFLTDYKASGIYQYDTANRVDDDHIRLLFYLLYSNYGNSSIASNDRHRFAYKLFSIIFQYGPAWVKKLDLQSKIRNLSDDELMKGGNVIYNHSFNPGTAPSTATLTELTAINDQNTTNYKKSKIEALSAQWDMITQDVTNAFLGKFKPLFTVITAPVYGLAFPVEEEEE